MKTLFKLSAVVFLCLIKSAMATSFSERADHDVKSANGKFILHVSAKDGNHVVTGDFHSNEAWKFSNHVAFQSFNVSHDGESVAVVDWALCKVDALNQPAVVIYQREGARRTFSYRVLSIPRERNEDEVGPVGDFWRVWRGDASLNGNLLTIHGEGRKPSVETRGWRSGGKSGHSKGGKLKSSPEIRITKSIS